MRTVMPRAALRSVPLTLFGLVTLVACADDTPLTAPSIPASAQHTQNLGGTVVMVTNTLGNGAFGSLLWATYLAANAGDTIRFDPSIAGQTIYMDNTLFVPNFVVIEGPKDKGITISGRNAVRVMDIRQGARLRNLNIIEGSHATHGGGILATGPLDLEHTAVIANQAPVGAGMYVTDAVLVNSTVAENWDGTGNFGHGAGVSYDYHGGLVLDNSTVVSNGGGSAIAPHGTRDRIPSVTLRNSIVAGSRIGCYDAIGLKYAGRNLVDDTSCGDDPFEPTMIRQDLASWYIDLSNPNGGPTLTTPLDVGSQAINNGKNCTFTVDQRYVPRDAKCDIGAFEFTDFVTATVVVNTTVNVNTTTGIATLAGTAKCSANGPERGQPNSLPLRVKLTQEQKVAGKTVVVYAQTGITVNCGLTTAGWSVPLTAFPYDKQWKDGAAVAQLETDPEATPQWIKPASFSAAASSW